MNKAILVGRLTKDVDLKTTASGISVCRFTIAVNRRFKNSEGNYDADFIPCTAFRKTAEFISKNFSKGACIGIVGSIQTGSYEKDGQRVFTTEIMVDEAYFVGVKTTESKTEKQPDIGEIFANADIPMPSDTDLPF